MTAEQTAANAQESDWAYLGRELRSRTCKPWAHVPFVIYVLIGIILFGGLGIWIELLKIAISCQPVELSGLITAVITFFPTLFGSTTLQFVLSSADRNDKTFIAFALMLLCLFLAIAILLPFFSETRPVLVLTVGIISSLFAVWVWWIANGDDKTFKPTPRSDAATGGALSKNLAGDIDGMNF